MPLVGLVGIVGRGGKGVGQPLGLELEDVGVGAELVLKGFEVGVGVHPPDRGEVGGGGGLGQGRLEVVAGWVECGRCLSGAGVDEVLAGMMSLV